VEASLESAKAGVSSAQEALSKAYVELNALVGYWPQDRPQLVTEIPIEKLKVESMDAEVNRAIASNTNVWNALQAIVFERQHLRMTIKDYEIAKMDVEAAELTAAQAKDELEKQFLLLYHDILTLEDGILAAQQGVAAAQQAVSTANAKLGVGMATRGELIRAQADLESAKNQLSSMKNSHATALSVFRNLTGRDPLPEILTDLESADNSI
jgi:outer membrane protein